MKKNYITYADGYGTVKKAVETYEEAEVNAKNFTAKNIMEVGIYELVAKTKAPVADIELVKVTA